MKPNILHIFVDQQRFDTIAALGNPIIKTPNLDRIANQGVAFTNAYTPCPVCIAARCSMIYGQYPYSTGCYENTPMPDDRRSFMDELAAAGYYTHGIGKCHFAPDSYSLRGFMSRERKEEGGARRGDNEPYLERLADEGYGYVMEPNGSRGEMYYIPQISQLPERLHPSEWIAERSIEFIRSRRTETQPWYLFASFIHPHPPFAPPNPWHKLYRASMMPLPNLPLEYESLQTFVNRMQNRYKYRGNGTDFNLLRVMKAYYYACISFVDYQVGKLLDCLDENGMTENTMIVFTSDHGEHLGDYNCFGKRTFHDSAARIPMLVYQKGRFEGGARCDVPVSLVDIAPTLLSAAGVDAPDMKLDGVDMHDILTGTSERTIVFGQHSYDRGSPIPENLTEPDAALRRAARSTYMAVSADWKYFYSAGDDKEYLFDRKSDPCETRNKAGVQFAARAKEQLKSALIAELTAHGETAGLVGAPSGEVEGIYSGKVDGFRSFPRYELPDDPDSGLLIQDMYSPYAKTEVDITGYDK